LGCTENELLDFLLFSDGLAVERSHLSELVGIKYMRIESKFQVPAGQKLQVNNLIEQLN